MEILKFTIFFLILLFFVSPFVHSKTQCPASHCGNNTTLPIIYPFRLQNQQTQTNCTYITNLTCTNQGLTILNLPNSGDFYVRRIDYESSLVQLYDPENCLPKRLMTLNLSVSYRLEPMYQLDQYTFYKCPSGVIRISNLTAIGCMSNSSSAIVATRTVSSQVMKKLYRCNAIVTAYVPVSGLSSHDFIGNQSDFLLTWSEANSRLVFEDIFYATRFVISIVGIAMPPVLCIACCAHFGRMLRKNDATG